MGKVQPCRNGCQKLITVQFDDQIGKYVPYEVDLSGNPTQRHNCPNSEYNKQQQGQGEGGSLQKTSTFNFNPKPQQEQATATDRPSLEATLLNQVSQKLNSLVDGHNELVGSLTEKLQTLDAIVKNSNIMLEAIVAHLKLTEPKKASQLYNETQEQKIERERKEIQGWNSTDKQEVEQ